jgi:hypothetical protein
MFRRRHEPEKKPNFIYSEHSKTLINDLPIENMLKVADSVGFLEHFRYREEHKTNVHLTKNGYNIWSMARGKVWMAYHEEADGALYLEWVSLISKFRR